MADKKKASPTEPELPAKQQFVFPDTTDFKRERVERPPVMSVKKWGAHLRGTEIKDYEQKLRARPWIAWGVGALLLAQNAAIFCLVFIALNNNSLKDLQPIFGAVIAGTLTQSYFLLRLITEKVFGDIDYHTNDKP